MLDENNNVNVSDETNKPETELHQYPEYSEAKEFDNVNETKRIYEIKQEDKPKTKKKKKITAWQHFITAATVVVAVVALNVGGIIPSLSNMSISKYYIGADTSSIFYGIMLDKYDEKTQLTVTIYNDFFNYTADAELVEDNFISGQIDGLKENMTYTFELRDGFNVLVEKRLVTREGEYYEYIDKNLNPEFDNQGGTQTEKLNLL